MEILDPEQMDPVSRELVREIRRNLPRLARHLRQEGRASGRASYVVLCAPRPAGDGLCLGLDAGEADRVRISLGPWSAEFATPSEGGRHSELAEALNTLEDLARSTALAYLLYSQGRYAESGLVRDERGEAALLSRLRPGHRLRLLSFDGQRDAVYER